MFASASQEPLQLASHRPLQSALGGTPSQRPSQLAEQTAWHEARHLVSPTAQELVQPPSQSAWHEPRHSKSPGSTWHSAWQLARQVPVHSTDASASQSAAHSARSRAAHAASTLNGVHLTSQFTPGGTSSHSASASTKMSPHASIPACASAGANITAATRAAGDESRRGRTRERILPSRDPSRT